MADYSNCTVDSFLFTFAICIFGFILLVKLLSLINCFFDRLTIDTQIKRQFVLRRKLRREINLLRKEHHRLSRLFSEDS